MKDAWSILSDQNKSSPIKLIDRIRCCRPWYKVSEKMFRPKISLIDPAAGSQRTCVQVSSNHIHYFVQLHQVWRDSWRKKRGLWRGYNPGWRQVHSCIRQNSGGKRCCDRRAKKLKENKSKIIIGSKKTNKHRTGKLSCSKSINLKKIAD